MVLVVQVVSSPASAAKAADMYVQRSTASEEDLSCIAVVFCWRLGRLSMVDE